VSIPLEKWGDFIEKVRIAIEDAEYSVAVSASSVATCEVGPLPKLVISCFGHMGDENLHLNILLRYLFYYSSI